MPQLPRTIVTASIWLLLYALQQGLLERRNQGGQMTEQQKKFEKQSPDMDRKLPGILRSEALVSAEMIVGLRRIEEKLDQIIRVQNAS